MQEMREFFKLHWPSVSVAAVLLVVTIYSSLNLVTTPRLWIDEALTIEMSRNLATQGTLDMQVAPGIFSGAPQYLQSTGYTVTYPLAVVFTVFKEGATQARIYMLVWLLCTLFLTYLVMQSIFGTTYALGGILLLSSFATLYADGRTVTGEVPGFFFLMAGIYLFLARPTPLLAGLLWGFAVVTKPSVYLLLIPAVILAVLLQKHESWADKARTLLLVGIGAIGPVVLWVVLAMPDAGNPHSWANLAAFYRNPYGTEAPPSLLKNMLTAIHSTTILYFGIWAAFIVMAQKKIKDTRQIFFYNFVLLYSAFALLYYLHSPGWLRYIFVGELLVLILLPHALSVFARTYRRYYPKLFEDKIVIGAVVLLVLTQLIQLSSFSHLFTSQRALIVSSYINEHEPHASVLSFQSLEMSTLLSTQQRYNSVALTGIPALDTNPLSTGLLPDLVVGALDNPHIIESRNLLERRYALQLDSDGLLIYKRSK